MLPCFPTASRPLSVPVIFFLISQLCCSQPFVIARTRRMHAIHIVIFVMNKCTPSSPFFRFSFYISSQISKGLRENLLCKSMIVQNILMDGDIFSKWWSPLEPGHGLTSTSTFTFNVVTIRSIFPNFGARQRTLGSPASGLKGSFIPLKLAAADIDKLSTHPVTLPWTPFPWNYCI